MIDQILGETATAQYDAGHDHGAAVLIGEDASLGRFDLREGFQTAFDFTECDAFAFDLDQIILSAHQRQASGLVDFAQIAGAQPVAVGVRTRRVPAGREHRAQHQLLLKDARRVPLPALDGGGALHDQIRAAVPVQIPQRQAQRRGHLQRLDGAQPGGLYHLGLRVPRRSTLSDAQTCRPAAVFRDICMHLMAHAKRSVRREAAEIVELIDATPIPLRDPRFTWAKADSRVRGLKVHVGYDARAEVIEWAEITAPNTTDIAVARARPIEPGRTYVFDKGYLDYNWWRRLHDGQARFVSRLKSNTRRRDVIAQPVHGQGIMADNLLKLGHAAPRGGARNELYGITLREIVVERDGKEKAKAFADQAFAVLTVVLIVFCAVVLLFMPQVLGVLARAGFTALHTERAADRYRVATPVGDVTDRAPVAMNPPSPQKLPPGVHWARISTQSS